MMIGPWTEIIMAEPARLLWGLLAVAFLIAWMLSAAVQRRWAQRLFGTAYRQRVAVWPVMLLRFVALFLVALAATDLRSGSEVVSTARLSLQLVVVLDRSRSMLAQDIAPAASRLELGKSLIRELMATSAGTPVALVTFAGDVRVDVPLTRDHRQVAEALNRIDPNDNVFFGSNFGEAVAQGVECFADRMMGEKLLIVVSDAEVPAGLAPPVLPDLPARTSINFIVLGNAQTGGRIPVEGQAAYLIHKGQVVWTRAQPQTAHAMAAIIGGSVIHVETPAALESATDHIQRSIQSQLQQSDGVIASISLAEPLYDLLILASLGLLLVATLVTLWQHTRPRPAGPFRPSAMLGLIVIAVLLGADSGPAKPARSPASYRQRVLQYNAAVEAYHNQDYNVAERLFREGSQDRNAELRARSTFNLANTIYRSVSRGGQTKQQAIDRLAVAIELYRQCMRSGHRGEDAAANVRIVQALIEQIERQEPSEREQGGDAGAGDQPSSQDQDADPGSDPPSNSGGADQPAGGPGDGTEGSPPPSAGGDGTDRGGGLANGDGASGGHDGPNRTRPTQGQRQPQTSAPQARPPLQSDQAESLLDDIRRRAADRASPPPSEAAPAAPISSMPW